MTSFQPSKWVQSIKKTKTKQNRVFFIFELLKIPSADPHSSNLLNVLNVYVWIDGGSLGLGFGGERGGRCSDVGGAPALILPALFLNSLSPFQVILFFFFFWVICRLM